MRRRRPLWNCTELGDIDPTFAFAQAVDPYTWRFRPTGPQVDPYGWGGHMTVGMPASYAHHIDYVREPVFLGQLLEAVLPTALERALAQLRARRRLVQKLTPPSPLSRPAVGSYRQRVLMADLIPAFGGAPSGQCVIGGRVVPLSRCHRVSQPQSMLGAAAAALLAVL